MIRSKLTSILLAIVLILSVFAGCGKAEEKSSTIRIMTVLGDEKTFGIYSSLLLEYSAENATVNIRDTSAKEENAFRLGATLASTYASVEAPHIVIYYSTTGIGQLSEYFASVDQIREQFPDYASNISLGALKSLDGYAVPLLGQWRGLLVNNKLLSAVGADPVTDWKSFITACQMLKASGYIPVANSGDECSILLEALVYGYGGENAVKNGLLSENSARSIWLKSFEKIGELSELGYTAPAAQSDAIVKYVSQSDLGEYQGSAAELFNSGKAAMVFVDNTDISNITDTSACSLVPIPLPEDAVNSSLIGGYDIGLYISKKAFENIEINNTVIELAEYLINESAQQRFAQIGFMPSNIGVSCEETVMCDVVKHFKESGSFSLSNRTASNRSAWEELELLCARLGYNIITPEQAALLWFDPSVSIDELLKEEAVSDSDAPVSRSDVEPE